MKPRIGLIASYDLQNEFRACVEDKGFTLLTHRFQRSEVDAILYVPTDAQTERRLIGTVNSADFQTAKPLLIACIGQSVQPSGLSQRILVIPSIHSLVHLIKVRHREQNALDEAKRRSDAATHLGYRAQPADPTTNVLERILFLGEPSPFFLRCTRDISSPSRKIEAALSERTAYDFLKYNKPSAIIVQLSNTFQPRELLEHIHQRNDLKDTPVIAISNSNVPIHDYDALLSAIVVLGQDDIENVTELLSTLGRQTQTLPMSPAEFGGDVKDKYSGAFSKDFAERYIEVGCNATRGSIHAVVSPFLLAKCDTLQTAKLAHFTKSVRQALRKEDMIARIDWEHFVISFYERTISEVENSLTRIQSLLETTDEGRTSSPMSFSYALVEAQPGRASEHVWNHIISLTKSTRDQASAVA